MGPESARGNPEIAETLRRRGELWQRAGDLSMRLGRVEDASACYEAAGKETSSDAGALAVRRVYAAVRSGRPAQAALALVDKLGVAGGGGSGGFEDRELGVVRYLADKTDVGPLLSRAIGRVLGDSATNASAKSRLARAKAAALPIALRREALVEHLSDYPSDRKAAADLLGSFTPDQLEARDRALASLVKKRPESADVYAALLLAEGRGVVAAAESLAARGDPASTLLSAYLTLALGRPANASAMLKPERFPGMLAAMLAARADLAGLSGDYEGAKFSLAALEALPIESTRFARARALSALQRYTEAMEVVRPLADSASVDERLLVAGFAMRSGDLSLGEKILAAVAEEDPQDERAAEVLLRLYSRGEKADQRQLASLVQRLREKVSSSRVLRWATAMELVQRGQYAAAEQSLLGLAEEDASGPGLLDALAVVWTRGGVVSLERGEAWLRARLASSPESTETLSALAQVVSARGRTDEALAMLRARIAVAPIDRLRRLVEILTSDPLAKPAEARALTIEQLMPTPRTIDSAIVLADTLIASGRSAEVDSVLASLPEGVPLTPEQKKALSAVVALLIDADMDAVIAGKPSGAASAMARLAALGIEPGPLVRESGLALLTLTNPPDLARIGEEFLAFTQGDAAKERLALGRLIQKLLASKKPGAVLTLAEAVSTIKSAKGVEPDDDLLRVLCVSIGQFGDGPDLRRVLPLVTRGSRAERVLDTMSLDAEPAPPPPKQPGMLAYRIAGIASSHERYEQAGRLYEVSLELDPDHAIALNDYGYMLLEHTPVATKEQRAKIESLLEKAYQADATSFNIVDSLGWLRYLQGRLEDDAAKGAIEGAGALSLLRRAVELQQREQDFSLDPFIVDHLGDALWANGEKDKAVACWQQAESKATTLLRARADNLAEDGNGKMLKKTLESASAKRQAAKNGKEPDIAPRWETLKP